MSQLALQAISPAGLTPVYGAASVGGDTIPIPGSGSVFAHVKNGGASSITVTITTQNKTYRGLTLPDRTVTVAAGGEAMIGPIDPELYSNNLQQAAIGYSAVTSVTVAALRI